MSMLRPDHFRDPLGDPLDLIHDSLESRGCGPHRTGKNGLRAICPACGETNRSKLSVKRGVSVPLVIHCFGGCDWQQVLDATGLPYTVALGEQDAEVFRRVVVRDAETLRHLRAAVEHCRLLVRKLETGEPVDWTDGGPLRLAARLVDDAARRTSSPRRGRLGAR